MIERTFDTEWFNVLCNLPEVRPGLGPDSLGVLDVSPLILNPANFALRSTHGGFILQAHGAGFYSVHTQFSSEGRGGHAISAMKAGLDFMFTRTDAMRIFSHCPDNNPATLQLAKAGGARNWFRDENNELFGPSQVVFWDLFQWVVDTPELEAEGREFHEITDAAIKEAKMDVAPHNDDPIHDRAVGASVRMCRYGQTRKGALAYSLWAAAAGYPQARFISDDPPTMDVGMGMVVSLGADGKMEVK